MYRILAALCSVLAFVALLNPGPARAIQQVGSISGTLLDTDFNDPSRLQDLDGDGKREICFTTGAPESVLVRKLTGPLLWQYDGSGLCPSCAPFFLIFVGFADLDPVAGREAVFRWDNSANMLGIAVVSTSTGATIRNFIGAQAATLFDLTDDGKDELIVRYEDRSEIWSYAAITGVSSHSREGSPETFAVLPNPFRRAVSFGFDTQSASRVGLRVYDVQGRVVRNFGVIEYTAGAHRVQWDGRDSEGQRLASGSYFGVIEVDGKTVAKKMVLLK